MWTRIPSRYSNSAIQQCRTKTVDISEINKFDKLSRNWWSFNSETNILLSMNQVRVPFIRDGLINTGAANADNIDTDKPLKGLKILDVGCGGGYLSEPLARIGADITGIDASESLISIANRHRNNDQEIWDRLTYTHSSIEDFARSNNSSLFDAVVSSEVIEHVNNQSEFVKNCVDCLKPGGSIFMTTISKTAMAQLFAIFLAENIFKIIPKGTHEYEKLISPHTLQRLLEETGCYTRRIHGFTCNPLTGKFYWISCHDISYAIQAIKLN